MENNNLLISEKISFNYNSNLFYAIEMAGKVISVCGYSVHDKLFQPKALLKTDIPASFNAVSREWFEEVLCGEIKNAKVEAFELGLSHSGTNVRQQYHIQYNDIGKEKGLPQIIFAKGTPTFKTRLLGLATLGNESTFYNKIRPHINIEAPRSYHSAADQTGRSIHLLEDLVHTKQANFISHDTIVTRQQAESAASTLADLHGAYYKHALLQSRDFNINTIQEFHRIFRLFKKNHFEGLEKAAHVVPNSLLLQKEKTWKKIFACIELHKGLPQTLLHNDVHFGNWYITGKDVMGLLDWQAMCSGHWSRDFAYWITSMLRVSDRRYWERDLLKLYLERMYELTGESIDFNEAWLRYRQQVLGPLIYGTLTYTPPGYFPKDLQPPELSLECIRRFSQAIEDLDSLEAL